MGGLLLVWTSYFTGRLSDTQSQYFCGVLSNWYLDLGIWGGGGFCWAGLVPSLVDCQIHNLSTSVEFSQIGIWIWGFGGGGFCWAGLVTSLLSLTFLIFCLALACLTTYPCFLIVVKKVTSYKLCHIGKQDLIGDCQIHNPSISVELTQIGIWVCESGGGGLLGWTSHFTGRLSNTQSLYFCGAHSNRYLDLGI